MISITEREKDIVEDEVPDLSEWEILPASLYSDNTECAICGEREKRTIRLIGKNTGCSRIRVATTKCEFCGNIDRDWFASGTT